MPPAPLSAAETVPTGTRLARIWDAPIRLFHWLLVALLGFSWWSGEQHEMEWHRLSGYCILFLLIFRLYWGFAGGKTARFVQFVRGPRAALAYVRSIGRSTPAALPGHTPIGGWSVLLMLGTLLTMVVAGLFAVDVDGLESGPLADYVSFDQGRAAAGVHGFVFNIVLALVALHVLAIAFYLVGLRHNLIGPMISGRRRVADSDPTRDHGASPIKAIAGIIVAGACTYWIARGFSL